MRWRFSSSISVQVFFGLLASSCYFGLSKVKCALFSGEFVQEVVPVSFLPIGMRSCLFSGGVRESFGNLSQSSFLSLSLVCVRQVARFALLWQRTSPVSVRPIPKCRFLFLNAFAIGVYVVVGFWDVPWGIPLPSFFEDRPFVM